MFALSSLTPIRHRLNGIMTSGHKLIDCVLNPYRPEQHYMRGPGPKWRAKHARHSENAAF
jgi:hypothetical protein